MEFKRNSNRIVLAITIITLVCKVLGFLKNSVLAYFFGTSPVVDAYVMTFSIGTITSGWIAGLIGNFTPKFKELEARDGRERALLFSSQVINLIFVLIIGLVVILELFAPSVVHIVAPGFSGETFSYTVHFFRIYCVSIIYYTVFRFSQEFLNCNQNHIAAVAPDLLMSSICILAIVVSHKIGADFLIFGYVIAIFLQSIVSHISTRKLGFRFRITELWNDELRALVGMAVPIFISDTLANINNLIDKMFASNLESGIVSSLDYANTMKEFAYQVGTIAIITMIFPVISKLWAEGNIDEFKKTVLRGLDYFSVLFIPIIVGIILVGDIAISIVFQRGEFTEAAARITSNSFVIYSISLIAMVYRCIFLKAFYAMQKTKYILIVSFVNVACNISFNALLVKTFGYLGLTTATTLAALICLPLYFLFFFRTVGGVAYKSFFGKLLKSVLASFAMGFIVYVIRMGIQDFLQGGIFQQVAWFAVIVASGVIVYSIVGRILKINEINHVFGLLFKKFKH